MRPPLSGLGRLGLMSLALLLVWGGGEVAAQTSIYGIRGLGYPGRSANARERGLGSGFTVLDLGSPVNPAAVAGFGTITVEIMAETNLRSYTIDTVQVTGLSSTRFPLAQLGGRIATTPLSFALSFSQYTDRSYDLTTADSLQLRGQTVTYEERTTSRGGIADLRGALGYRLGSRLWLGAGVHVLTGSAKLTFSRLFADTAYRPYQIETEESISGFGVSAGAIFLPSDRFAFGLAVRSDTRAKVEVDSAEAANVDLPFTVTGGARVSLGRPLRWGTTVTWRSWSMADDDLDARAFDTWEIGTGLEFGGAETGTSRFPVRVGFRYATLPFSATDEQPHELTAALGIGLAFAGGRGLIDAAIERAMRSGAGAEESAWQLSWTVTVRP
ncbi:MAG: hypothetical protein OEY20_06740 [Gemmatimonadota bacterium]|nr:hypothetical protein [Gemmatimonadota bacterium]MDH5196931.1 hypothetical protein [Gemmatimonadota bacterium]